LWWRKNKITIMSKTTDNIIDEANEGKYIIAFNSNTAIAIAVKALVKKYPNNQELGEAIRSLINSFE